MSKKSSYKHVTGKQNGIWWRLYESRWLCTSIEHKKYMKDTLNRMYRRKGKQEKLEQEAETDD